MQEANTPRHEQTIAVPARAFSERLGELSQSQPGVSVPALAGSLREPQEPNKK